MASTINQISANPTNKLAATTITTAAMSLIAFGLRTFEPQYYDPEVILALTPVVGYAVGWYFKDNPNIVVVTQEPEQ